MTTFLLLASVLAASALVVAAGPSNVDQTTFLQGNSGQHDRRLLSVGNSSQVCDKMDFPAAQAMALAVVSVVTR